MKFNIQCTQMTKNEFKEFVIQIFGYSLRNTQHRFLQHFNIPKRARIYSLSGWSHKRWNYTEEKKAEERIELDDLWLIAIENLSVEKVIEFYLPRWRLDQIYTNFKNILNHHSAYITVTVTSENIHEKIEEEDDDI